MIWPPDYQGEFARRCTILDILDDARLRAAAMEHYRDNPIDWINDFCITFDPRNAPPLPRLIPFTLFPKQADFILFLQGCLRDKESGLVEKCRDVGASWLAVAFSVWLWLFQPGATIGWGSRKEEYVDRKGDAKALFPKMRQIIDTLPPWMQPKGFNPRLHASRKTLLNPENGASIIGEAGDYIGRGGRTTIYFIDESAYIEHPEAMDAALGDNTQVRIDISSVNGTGNSFYKRRMAGEEWSPGKAMPKGFTRVFIFDWRDHPGKTQAWYDERRDKAEREGALHILAQEVDRDYSGSQVGVIIPQEWVKAAVNARQVLMARGFEWPLEGMKRAMQDVADGGGDKNALVIGQGNVCIFAKNWGGEAGEAAKVAVPICAEYGVNDLYYDSIGVGAGFKTQINTMKALPSWPGALQVHPWNAGAPPLNPDQRSIPGDQNSPLNKDQYKNLKAQAWFAARARFYKTWRAVVHKDTYPWEELISINSDVENLNGLCNELSQAVRKQNDVGKTVVEKTPDGTFSPNLADAFIGWNWPARKLSIFDVL